VRAAAEALGAFRRELQERPVVEAVERFVEASPLLAIAAAARDGEQRVANLRKLGRDAAEAAERDGRPLADVVREIVGRRTRVEGDSESSLADVDVEAVRILTIHKAKGLEFDVVVIGDLARRPTPPREKDPSASWVPTDLGPRLAIVLNGACNVAQVLRAERDALHEEAESKRLFYVATTRAKQRLVLVVGDQDGPPGRWLAPLGALGYARDPTLPDGPLSHPHAHHRRIRMPARVAEPRREQPADVEALTRSVQRYERAAAAARSGALRFQKPSAHDEAADLAFEPLFDDDEPVVSAAADLARVVGIACHLALARSGPDRTPTDAQIELAAREACAESGLDRERVTAETRALLAAAPAKSLLASLAGVDPMAVELPILLAGEGGPWRGTADVLFRDGGRLVLGDWKTDREGDFDELAQRYRPQLTIYAKAIQGALALEEPPALELLLLRHGRRLAL
jgi:ATP-dependent helicase/nuclease subunit A